MFHVHIFLVLLLLAKQNADKPVLGASLVQLYTALALEGPDLPARVIRELATLLAADGVSDIAAARGQIPDPDKAMQHALRLAQSA